MNRKVDQQSKLIVLGIVLFSSLLWYACGGPSDPKIRSKQDTSQTWLKYFNRIGVPITSDTETFAIRIIRDSFFTKVPVSPVEYKIQDGDTLYKTEKRWIRDTIYYVPYDTIVPTDHLDSTRGIYTHHVTTFKLLPAGFQLFDYNKIMRIQVAQPVK